MLRATTTRRDASDALALAALALLGEALPARFPGARTLHVVEEHRTARRWRLSDRVGRLVKNLAHAELVQDGFAALVTRAVETLNASEGDVWLVWRGALTGEAAGFRVDLAECARVLREVLMSYDFTVVGAWSRPEQVPGCQDREPVDAFVEHVEAPGCTQAVQIALERQTREHPQEAAPADAGYGMEPYAIAVFPLRLWPTAN